MFGNQKEASDTYQRFLRVVLLINHSQQLVKTLLEGLKMRILPH